ncbi:hypothetical protein KXD40_008867 [Peronospora effusa]|uniref:Uncharacterized protein n=1 Tax=Peronospora effusa TaxID=542832 RepID=A0A3R7YPH1_9STRA|nr:hypothetical protein DD237_007963 [Peronospora effusa]UIZ21838.1 hypothetical protein KXD40_008867 [Peronospora effusa]
MIVLISANFEEDYNVKNTVIARAAKIYYVAIGWCLFERLRYLTDERVNGVLDSSLACHL